MAYSPQQLRDIVEWDIPNWSAALSYWERHTGHCLASARVLEIGGRHGGLSLAMALKGAWVVCTDIAGPTDKALRKHTAYQVTDRICYAYVDALRIPYRECFDVVLFKSVLGGIGRADQREKQAQAVSEMFLALKPGGRTLVCRESGRFTASPEFTQTLGALGQRLALRDPRRNVGISIALFFSDLYDCRFSGGIGENPLAAPPAGPA